MCRSSFRGSVLAALCALAAFAAIAGVITNVTAQAQTPAGASQHTGADYALIFGTVWGADGHPVYGIPVKIRRADDKKARWDRVSDHSGEFAQRVPAGSGDYVIWADVKTPKGGAKPETKVHVENDERVDVGLHLLK